jgi:hypothetical protein
MVRNVAYAIIHGGSYQALQDLHFLRVWKVLVTVRMHKIRVRLFYEAHKPR